ncbi:tissue alpha-L-fucosidase-like [Dermacentor andersoni]|uniref:tissue alpha-L-fucosidase-like n=1 Tax=Dermacentor andersoni TaxID=34620 RepID=UPI003B3A1698
MGPLPLLSTGCLLFLALAAPSTGRYAPDWNSLDTRPTPAWYDEAKIGIFLHWGLFSVPSFGSEWFWWHWQGAKVPAYREFMERNYRPGFTYQDFAPQFKAEFFDPDRWAEIFKKAGARYVVLTSKHHEGFTLWPSAVSWNWNAGDVGPRRDLVGDLARAVRKKGGIRFGLYHSLYEWFNPLYLADKETGFETNHFVARKTMPELVEIVTTYRPEIIWSDGDWEAPDTYWNSTQFLAWLYNDSPVRDTVLVNDRWGKGTPCKHGDFYNCKDHYDPGTLVEHKWENAMTVDKDSWGYRRNARLADYHTIEELLAELASTVSCNGNFLLNVGPTSDGVIHPAFEERLTQMGTWLDVNGEAIYGSRPWRSQNDTVAPGVWYTSKNDTVYAIVLKWPKNNKLALGSLSLRKGATVSMLGLDGYDLTPYNAVTPENWRNVGLTVITFPPLTPDVLPTPWAWVLKIQGAL